MPASCIYCNDNQFYIRACWSAPDFHIYPYTCRLINPKSLLIAHQASVGALTGSCLTLSGTSKTGLFHPHLSSAKMFRITFERVSTKKFWKMAGTLVNSVGKTANNIWRSMHLEYLNNFKDDKRAKQYQVVWIAKA